MSHNHIEQDAASPIGGNELPTYDDLAEQQGPNSRFGRWRGWIEKRAAERYLDNPRDRSKGRERGWDLEPLPSTQNQASGVPAIVNVPPTPTPLQITTDFSSMSGYDTPYEMLPEPPETARPTPIPFVSQPLPPTHLKLSQFGSRFLPHTTTPIRCLLPLLSDRLLLIGHDDGLSVLDMFPREWNDETGELLQKSPADAEARPIWTGEGVFQMSVLEVENTGEGSAQGVVLVLVAPETDASSSRDAEGLRSLRMYNLASLTSLAKWAVANRGARPLDMKRPANWNAQQTPSKKHRPQSSISRLKRLIDPPSNAGHHSQSLEPSTSSYHTLLSPSPSLSGNGSSSSLPSGRTTPHRINSDDSSGWDVVEDLPLRWATDFVPLASSGSRLSNVSVLSYALWHDEERKVRGEQMLAIATKSSIFLYETPRGERSFRFVKEFYTPLQPRGITFFQQSAQDVFRAASSVNQAREANTSRDDRRRTISLATPTHNPNYGPQLSLFVVFDKKAGSIRLVDSAVGEIELFEAGMGHHSRESLSPTSRRSMRHSIESNHSFGVVNSTKWTPLSHCDIPRPLSDGSMTTKRVYLLTKGKITHIVPYPLPANVSASAPLYVINWESPPTSVTPRVCSPTSRQNASYIQLIALGETGIEVQEVPLSFLSKGKGKASTNEVSRHAEEQLLGATGFLSVGGSWTDGSSFNQPPLSRASSTTSSMSGYTHDSEYMQAWMREQQGIYAWCRKGALDWRVVWLGGPLTNERVEED